MELPIAAEVYRDAARLGGGNDIPPNILCRPKEFLVSFDRPLEGRRRRSA
jgi:hypothetical protein